MGSNIIGYIFLGISSLFLGHIFLGIGIFESIDNYKFKKGIKRTT